MKSSKESEFGEAHGWIKNKAFSFRAVVPFDRKNPKIVIDDQNVVKQWDDVEMDWRYAYTTHLGILRVFTRIT